MSTRATTIRRSRRSTGMNSSLVGGIAALLIALVCAWIVLGALSHPSISLTSILVVVVAAVGGIAALTVSAVVFVAGLQFNSVRR